jgi:hypothetical protein
MYNVYGHFDGIVLFFNKIGEIISETILHVSHAQQGARNPSQVGFGCRRLGLAQVAAMTEGGRW